MIFLAFILGRESSSSEYIGGQKFQCFDGQDASSDPTQTVSASTLLRCARICAHDRCCMMASFGKTEKICSLYESYEDEAGWQEVGDTVLLVKHPLTGEVPRNDCSIHYHNLSDDVEC